MSEIKLPKDFIFDEEEEIIEEVPKELEEGTLPEEAKPIRRRGVPFFGNVISPDSKTGTVQEEVIRGISKIVDKVQGKEVEEDATLIESLTGAGISAGIKIPKGLVTFGTLLYDIFQEEDIPVDETLTGKLMMPLNKQLRQNRKSIRRSSRRNSGR